MTVSTATCVDMHICVTNVYVYMYENLVTLAQERLDHADLRRNLFFSQFDYGVATISRLLNITGQFCRISSLL